MQVNAVNAGVPKHCCSNEWKSQGREDECGGWVGDYLCFITPTDSCECNKYNETVEGRVKQTGEMLALCLVVLCCLCKI